MVLTKDQAIAAEDEMRRMESDPVVTKQELRLFMQSLMPCGHIHANLLTCPDPPYGCAACIATRKPDTAALCDHMMGNRAGLICGKTGLQCCLQRCAPLEAAPNNAKGKCICKRKTRSMRGGFSYHRTYVPGCPIHKA